MERDRVGSAVLSDSLHYFKGCFHEHTRLLAAWLMELMMVRFFQLSAETTPKELIQRLILHYYLRYMNEHER